MLMTASSLAQLRLTMKVQIDIHFQHEQLRMWNFGFWCISLEIHSINTIRTRKMTGRKIVFGSYFKSCNAFHDRKYSEIFVFHVIFGPELVLQKGNYCPHAKNYRTDSFIFGNYCCKKLQDWNSIWINFCQCNSCNSECLANQRVTEVNRLCMWVHPCESNKNEQLKRKRLLLVQWAP